MTKPILLTLGDPSGIGPELALMLWAERSTNGVKPFVFLANHDFIKARAERLNLTIPTTSWEPGNPVDASDLFRDALPVLTVADTIHDQPGEAHPENGKAVVKAIENAVTLIKQDIAGAVVTNPINKKALYDVGFDYPGHTEFLGDLAGQWGNGPYQPVMMLAGPELRTVPATVHIPLYEVPGKLNTEELEKLIFLTHEGLKSRFGMSEPRLVVTGLNPHAGEEGTMGHEDDAIIRPAIERTAERGILVTGPHPADTLFHAARRETYDAAIAMYHDQALLPVKTLAFDETVNVTLGLPFIRTSPDHGTAFDIAGQGIARPNSLLAAINMAHDMVAINSAQKRGTNT